MLDLYGFAMVPRALFMTVLFLLSTFNVCCLPNVFRRGYKLITKLLTVVFIVFSFSFCVILTTGIYALLDGKEIPQLSLKLGSNAEYVLFFMLVNSVFLVLVVVGEYRYIRNSVSTLSIKESFDHLPTGLCFSKANGTVQLVNHKMNELSHLITGEELQNANRFWRILCNGSVLADVQRLSKGKQPEFRLSDGTIYTFAREKVENVFQLTATDTTGLHKLKNRLQSNNEELEEMDARLRAYGETVDETTRARERLETKIRIHSELGQALLATRHCLHQPDADFQPVLNAWKRNIAVLRTEAEPSQNTDLLQSLIAVAESAGVSVEINGCIPQDETVASVMTSAATEALTNAVRHAQATTLFVEFTESDEFYFARYTNDGNVPDKEINEGGGLGSLRNKIERCGGEMHIQSVPKYVLDISLPKEVSRF